MENLKCVGLFQTLKTRGLLVYLTLAVAVVRGAAPRGRAAPAADGGDDGPPVLRRAAAPADPARCSTLDQHGSEQRRAVHTTAHQVHYAMSLRLPGLGNGFSTLPNVI